MNQNLATFLREEPERLRVLSIHAAKMGYLTLHLHVLVAGFPKCGYAHVNLVCTNVVDYAIRPSDPATIEGGPLIEFHEQHPLIDACGQMIPGGDGDQFDPPLKLSVLLLDQSYVVAEKFEIQKEG
jgi:hypothetical protein